MYTERLSRVRKAMEHSCLDVILLSIGPELPWLTGYRAFPLERLTMLVLPISDTPKLFVPSLEAPRVEVPEELFSVRAWKETEDPVALVAEELRGSQYIAITDQTWSRFLLELQERCESCEFSSSGSLFGELRAQKDEHEIAALRAAARGVDAVVEEMRSRPFSGRSEVDVARELRERIVEHGHEHPDFWIVASGPNGASPHHDASDRIIQEGDVVVCDFGGTMKGYCSDITRVFSVGEPSGEVKEVFEIVRTAQQAGFEAATVGTPASAVDAAARNVIVDAGFGERFVHRTGHGIGIDVHEDPYIVATNDKPLQSGNVFSIEPGIYLLGKFGVRLEDIVVATGTGPVRLNEVSHDLAIVS